MGEPLVGKVATRALALSLRLAPLRAPYRPPSSVHQPNNQHLESAPGPPRPPVSQQEPPTPLPSLEIIGATRVACLRRVPPSARRAFAEGLRRTLSALQGSNPERWLRLFAFTKVVLATPRNCEGDAGDIVARRCRRFTAHAFAAAGDMWLELLSSLPAPAAPGAIPIPTQGNVAACVKLARQGFTQRRMPAF